MTMEYQSKMYLDFQATTPVDPRVLDKMLPYFTQDFGNPSSQDHSWGWTASRAVERAREQVAQLLGAKTSEIFFTSGATESNNWVLIGLVRRWIREDPLSPVHVITSEIEHKSVLEPLRAMKKEFGDRLHLTFLKPGPWGRYSLDQFVAARTPHTRLVSLHWAHNELGTIQNMPELAAWSHENKIYLHSDATQAIGKIPVDLSQTLVDLISFSSHKLYGPKGVGGLYIRNKDPRVSLDPYFYGGGQERGLRAGTLNVPGIVGLGEACAIAAIDITHESKRSLALRERLVRGLREKFPALKTNSHPEFFLPHALSLTFVGVDLGKIQGGLSHLAMSSGSACGSGELAGSPVLRAIGLSEKEAQSTLRVSVGRWTTDAQVDFIIESFSKAMQTA